MFVRSREQDLGEDFSALLTLHSVCVSAPHTVGLAATSTLPQRASNGAGKEQCGGLPDTGAGGLTPRAAPA